MLLNHEKMKLQEILNDLLNKEYTRESYSPDSSHCFVEKEE